ncbi:hypothetical protein ABZ419_18925 [Streptomyces cinnamoneus]|uniref:TolB family protein n=1 Tax=Streptomyces cinnamoneus TaxID=53446 RepID=UPI0033D0FFE8
MASDGTQGNGYSADEKISGDGRLVVFTSYATSLVPGSADGTYAQVFARDLRTGRTEQVSLAGDGTSADRSSASPSVSANGRFVAFHSNAKNLTSQGNPSGRSRVYVRDRWTGRTEPLLPNGQDDLAANSPSISADGRYVAFASTRSDLVPGDTNEVSDVFVRDRLRGTTERVSIGSDGTQADRRSEAPVISADGSRVGFKTAATNLVPRPKGAGAGADLQSPPRPPANRFFVRDVHRRSTEPAARTYDGGETVAVSGDIGFSPDGRYALFSSYSSSVVRGDSNTAADVFATDLRTGSTQRLSLAPDGSQTNGSSYYGAAMSADNRRVFFASEATNLVAGDTNGKLDVFVRDLQSGKVERLSVADDGAQANEVSTAVAADWAGRTAVFSSEASNLVPGDTNDATDVFVRRLERR